MTGAEAPGAGRQPSLADDADRAVLERVASGQLDALEELYDRYRTMAYSIALRRRRPTTELPDVDSVPPAALTLPDVWPEVAAGLDRDTVRSALLVLSDVQREALELAYFGGLTQQEIAARTDTPLGTVKSRMRLGLLTMRRALVGDAPLPGGRLAGDERGAGDRP